MPFLLDRFVSCNRIQSFFELPKQVDLNQCGDVQTVCGYIDYVGMDMDRCEVIFLSNVTSCVLER